jgi:hypothetical protein
MLKIDKKRQSKMNSSLTNKTIQLLNTQTKQKQHKKQHIK